MSRPGRRCCRGRWPLARTCAGAETGRSVPTTTRINVDVVVVVVVLTLTHGYNAVCSHRTGSNDSGAEDYLRRVLVVEGYHAQHDKNPNCSLFNYYLCPEISTTFG